MFVRRPIPTQPLTELTAITLVILILSCASCTGSDFSGVGAGQKQNSETKKNGSGVDNADPDTLGSDPDPATTDKPATVSGSDDTIISASGETIKKIVIGEEGDCSTVSNLVENSDFEKGNTGFTSRFTFDGTCRGRYSPGSAFQYSVNATPSTCHVGYAASTGDKGQMLVVNMPAAGQTENRFWCQTLHVNAGKTYRLSARLRAAVPSVTESQPTFVAFTIDGTEVMATFRLEKDWKEHRQVSIPKTSGDIVFCGESRTQNTESTDLISDDFTFGECKE
jgi:hypothetical protein